MRKDCDIDPAFIHSSYLINLAALDKSLLEKSSVLLARELDLADSLGADYVVLHTGSASQDTEAMHGEELFKHLKGFPKKKSGGPNCCLRILPGKRVIYHRVSEILLILWMV